MHRGRPRHLATDPLAAGKRRTAKITDQRRVLSSGTRLGTVTGGRRHGQEVTSGGELTSSAARGAWTRIARRPRVRTLRRTTTKHPRRRNGCGQEEAETRFVLLFCHQPNLPGAIGLNLWAALEGHTGAGPFIGFEGVTGRADQVDAYLPACSKESPPLLLGEAAWADYLDDPTDAARTMATLMARGSRSATGALSADCPSRTGTARRACCLRRRHRGRHDEAIDFRMMTERAASRRCAPRDAT